MESSSSNLIKLSFIILILFGIYEIYPFGYFILRVIEGKVSIDLSHPSAKIFLIVRSIISLFSLLLGASLIISGIGIYRLKKWARRLAILALSLELFLRLQHTFFFPLEKSTLNIIEIIIAVLLCSLVIIFLSLKSVKTKLN